MKLIYSSIKEFEDTYNTNYDLYNTQCSCGAYFEMHLENINVSIGEYEIQIDRSTSSPHTSAALLRT